MREDERNLIKLEESQNRDSLIISHRINTLESEIEEVQKLTNWKAKLQEIRKELNRSNPLKKSRLFQFQGRKIFSLRDILDYLETNVSSLNYILLIDLYTIFDHIYYNMNPSKPTLDFFQVMNKLLISTPGHTITIQLFHRQIPKFFPKTTDHNSKRDWVIV